MIGPIDWQENTVGFAVGGKEFRGRYPENIGKTWENRRTSIMGQNDVINHTFANGVYQIFVVELWMAYQCFTNIISFSCNQTTLIRACLNIEYPQLKLRIIIINLGKWLWIPLSSDKCICWVDHGIFLRNMIWTLQEHPLYMESLKAIIYYTWRCWKFGFGEANPSYPPIVQCHQTWCEFSLNQSMESGHCPAIVQNAGGLTLFEHQAKPGAQWWLMIKK